MAIAIVQGRRLQPVGQSIRDSEASTLLMGDGVWVRESVFIYYWHRCVLTRCGKMYSYTHRKAGIR